MKKPRFSLFTPSLHMLVPSLATSLVLSITTAYGAINEMTTGNTFGTPGNWLIGTAPVGNANSGSHTDLLFTTPSTTINHGGTFVYARSYNVTNGTSYIINSNRLVADAGATVFRVGSTAAASPPATFTNEVSGIDNDLVYLSNNSNLTFDGVNPVEGGLAPTLNLRLSTGNFNISEGSTLTIGMSLTGSGTNAIVVNGNGTTVLSGTGTTTVRNGTLEISGTNAGINYTLAGTVNPSEPVLKLSNVNALPVTAIISGANSTALDGIVDLAVAGSYTMGSYNLGNITCTTTSGSPTTLTFTDASTVTTTANGGRTFNNGSPDLSILFSRTLDIGGDVVATINLNGSGNTTVSGGIISTGTNVRSLAKGGTGTLTLNGEGTYAGTTTLNAGVLRLGHANALPGGIAATGGTSNLVFNATTAVIGLTAASGDFLRTVGTGADQVTANPTEDPELTRRMGFAAFGGNRLVDFGAPISLWYLYEFSQDPKWLAAAQDYTSRLDGVRNFRGSHDVGFILGCSYGNGYRLTKNPAYPAVMRDGAASLARRFNPQVGQLRSWDHGSWSFPVIVDNLMNLEFLLSVTRESGETRFREISISHADKTLQNHFRPDSSSCHVVDYDPSNGEVLAKKTHQGATDDSAWARGQAWGLYGYTMMFRETKNPAYLAQAVRIADFILKHPRLPADKLPYWDFDAPRIPNAPRDASAAAVMASALIELSGTTEGDQSRSYLTLARQQLISLSSPAYLAKPGENGNFLLMHCVGHLPKPSEVDVPLNYADYYFLEALLRYQKSPLRP